jgi:hypothetical protein
MHAALLLIVATSGDGMIESRLEGWKLLIEPAARRDANFPAVQRELTRQLQKIKRVVPEARVRDLQAVNIWIHKQSTWTQCMAYHPSPEWLRDNKLPPAMAGSIEIGNLENFLTWTHEQPWMVLHELAHGYHHKFIEKGYESPELQTHFDRITASKLYDEVMRYNGKMVRHYALTNQMEYFAESTEAYFGTNDFFPFVRAELRKFDPETDALMEKLWGIPLRKAN